MKYNLPVIQSLKDLENYFPNIEIIANYNTYEKFVLVLNLKSVKNLK